MNMQFFQKEKTLGEKTVQFMHQSVEARNFVGEKLVTAREMTELFKEEDEILLDPRESKEATIIEVTLEKTIDAAQRLVLEGYDNPCVLNFASATCPGGGFLGRARAQEENLCRVSGLYWCLKDQPLYSRNISQKDGKGLYLHDLLYSPSVPVFRDAEHDQFLEEKDMFDVGVITSPAPNNGVALQRGVSANTVSDIVQERIRRILTVAANKQHASIVLGAFGCGVFRNQPDMVANHFNHFLSGPFRGVFKKVVFAVYEKENGPNITVFRNVMDCNQHAPVAQEKNEMIIEEATRNEQTTDESDKVTGNEQRKEKV